MGIWTPPGASRSKTVIKAVMVCAAAVTAVGFGIAASLPANADEILYQEAFDPDLGVAHDKANALCLEVGFSKSKGIDMEAIIDASGAKTYRVVMQCLGPNGEQMISSDYGIAPTKEEAFAKAMAACEARGFRARAALYAEPIPETNEWVVSVSCGIGDGEPGAGPIIY